MIYVPDTMSCIVDYEEVVCAVMLTCPRHHLGIERELRIRFLQF